MPALTADQSNAAIIAHSQVNVDGDIGIQWEEDGMILTAVNCTPTRTVKEKMDGLGRECMTLFTTPKLTIGLEFETTLKASLIPGAHPGTALTLAEFASLNDDTLMGFPTATGFLSILSNTRTGKQGDLYGGSVSAKLNYLPSADTYVVRAA